MVFFWPFILENIKQHLSHWKYQEMFLEHQIKSALEWFMKADSNDWSNDWKFSFAITGINYVLQYITPLLQFFVK